jgi:hypothetical protein
MIARLIAALFAVLCPISPSQAQQVITTPLSQITGTWTPVDNSGAALTLAGVSASYTRIGNMVFAYARLAYPITGDGSSASIGGLPFNVANATYGQQCQVTYAQAATLRYAITTQNTAHFELYTSARAVITNAVMSNSPIVVICAYPIS